MSEHDFRVYPVSVPLEYPVEVRDAIDEAHAARERMLDDVEATLGPEARTRLEAAEANALALMSDAILYGVRIVDTQGRRVDPSRVYSTDREPTLGRSPLEALDGLIAHETRAQARDVERLLGPGHRLELEAEPLVVGPGSVVDAERAWVNRRDVARAFGIRPELIGLAACDRDERQRTAPHGDPLR